MPTSKPYLIISQSGRALAASAHIAGLPVHVIDLFADMDTQRYSLSTQIVSGDSNGINTKHLQEILNKFDKCCLEGVVTGSGLEGNPDFLNSIRDHWQLYGNDSAVMQACTDPEQFFKLLDKHGISYPETALSPVVSRDEWVIKYKGGTGGVHIQHYSGGDIPSGSYIQRKIAGRTYSIVFLASYSDTRVIGVNQIWNNSSQDSFQYRRAITNPDVDKSLVQYLEEVIQILSKDLNLTGLCGIDVIVDKGGKCYVLEINPRPTATFELHERDISLFYAHIRACQGQLVVSPEKNSIHYGHEIIYAPSDFRMPEVVWPEWVKDRPATGTFIASDRPICTIFAAAPSLNGVMKYLEKRKVSLYMQLGLQRIAA